MRWSSPTTTTPNEQSAIYYKDAPYFDLANVFMLAWPYGYPSIMSSYAFDRATGVVVTKARRRTAQGTPAT